MIIIVIILLKIKFNIIIEYIPCNNKFKKRIIVWEIIFSKNKIQFYLITSGCNCLNHFLEIDKIEFTMELWKNYI